jgi:hypothetical protein
VERAEIADSDGEYGVELGLVEGAQEEEGFVRLAWLRHGEIECLELLAWLRHGEVEYCERDGEDWQDQVEKGYCQMKIDEKESQLLRTNVVIQKEECHLRNLTQGRWGQSRYRVAERFREVFHF